MISVIVFALICQAWSSHGQGIGPFPRPFLNNENLLGGPLSNGPIRPGGPSGPGGPGGPGYKTMVIYNELMRQYYEVVKRYLDYKNRSISTINLQNPEFRYLEELLSRSNENDLRGLLGIFGTPVNGQFSLFGNI